MAQEEALDRYEATGDVGAYLEAKAFYERAIALDPSLDKARYQLIGAHAGLREPEHSSRSRI